MATVGAPQGWGRSAWTAIRHGQQMNGIGLTAVASAAPGANNTFGIPLFTAPPLLEGGSWKVEAASLLLMDTMGDWPIGDPARFWAVHLFVAGGALDTVGGINNNGQVLVTDEVYTIPVQGPESTDPQDVFLEPGDTVFMVADKTGQGATAGNLDLSNQIFSVTLFLRQSPPGR